jgi:four helix bundle protein
MAEARFRDSVAWQRAMTLVTDVYTVTTNFPKQEMFGLTNQLRRASISVASNIAEGQGRLTTGEFVHFLGMARGSCLEVQTQLEAAKRLGFGDEQDLRKADATAGEVVRMLNASIATNKARITARKSPKPES